MKKNSVRKPALHAKKFNGVCEVSNPHWARGNYDQSLFVLRRPVLSRVTYLGWEDDEIIINVIIVVRIS